MTLLMASWLFTWLVMYSHPSGVKAQAIVDTPTPTPTSTSVPIIKTETPVPEGYYDCPASPPAGWGTVTPSGVWQLRCGHCTYNNEVSTPTPGVQDTPTPDLGELWVWKVGEVVVSDYSNSNYWYQYDIKVPDEFFVDSPYPKFTVYERLYYQSSAAFELLRDVDQCFVADNDYAMRWERVFYPGLTNQTKLQIAQNASGMIISGEQPGNAGNMCVSTKNGYRTFRGRREDGTYGDVGRIHFFMLKDTPPPVDRIYEVKWVVDNMAGDINYTAKMKASCGIGDQVVGYYVAQGIQASSLTSIQTSASILDTGFAPIQWVGGDYGSQVSIYQSSASGYAQNIYPYAEQVDAIYQSPVIFSYSRNFTGGQVSYEFSLVCYGRGEGSLSNLDSYCSTVEEEGFGLELPTAVYQDRSCATIPSVQILDFETPSIEVCARVITMGDINLFGLVLNLDTLLRAMLAVWAVMLIAR